MILAEHTRTDYLRSIPYFETLDLPRLEWLGDQMIRRGFAPDEVIFLEGEPAAGVWMIEYGRVKIAKINLEGGEHILHLLGAGSTFNDIAALDGGANPANAVALSSAVIWLLPKTVLNQLLEQDNSFAVQVVHVLAYRARTLVHQIEDLTLCSITARLARFLLKQAENPALNGPGVTRVAIASHLATTPESISRSLRALEKSGAIEFDRHRIIIVDEDLLRSLAAL